VIEATTSAKQRRATTRCWRRLGTAE